VHQTSGTLRCVWAIGREAVGRRTRLARLAAGWRGFNRIARVGKPFSHVRLHEPRVASEVFDGKELTHRRPISLNFTAERVAVLPETRWIVILCQTIVASVPSRSVGMERVAAVRYDSTGRARCVSREPGAADRCRVVQPVRSPPRVLSQRLSNFIWHVMCNWKWQ
jgi:hypothetical protein